MLDMTPKRAALYSRCVHTAAEAYMVHFRVELAARNLLLSLTRTERALNAHEAAKRQQKEKRSDT